MHKKVKLSELSPDATSLTPTYAARALTGAVPKYAIPESEMAPNTAYHLIHDELRLDGFSLLNLATFVTTWMEPEAEKLISETLDKNMIDKDEYPQTAEIEKRCVNILANLWHAPGDGDAVGTSTIGSSEACMLGGMALKWRWRERQRAAGKPADRPNLVMGANTQVCWHKFCRYWDVEPREVTVRGRPLHPERRGGRQARRREHHRRGRHHGQHLRRHLRAGRQGGERRSTRVQEKQGWDIPIHVDGASGGFVAPFLQPDLEWDFRVPRVQSINTSGHKYGLVYPGVGWVDLPRPGRAARRAGLPRAAYLGGDMIDFSINFSRPGNQVIAQYYNFLRLGLDGYARIQQACQDVALYLSGEIAKIGPFELITKGDDIPVFCWTMTRSTRRARTSASTTWRRSSASGAGWCPPTRCRQNREDLVVQRVVVKEDFSRDLADLLLDDIRRALQHFAEQPGRTPKESGSHFSH